MRRSLHHRLPLLVTLLAWMTQLSSAPAHALLMPADSGGAAAWCGPTTAGLMQKALALPSEIRPLAPRGQDACELAECAAACAIGNVSGPAPDTSFNGVLPDREHTTSLPLATTGSMRMVYSPEARGPPTGA